jgi:conjugal transfer/entry exclusion protein
MKEIKRIEAGYNKRYKGIAEQYKESVLNIDAVLKSSKQSTMYKCVKCLVDAGATRVTVRNNPDFDHYNPYAENFYIFTGYK